jgi:hypothetical protein
MKKTEEERMVPAKEDGVNLSPEEANDPAMQQLPDEDVETVSGGSVGGTDPNLCNGAPGKSCKFKKTGNTRPGTLWGLNWEVKCIRCGKTQWRRFEPDE